jgi:hypothetical protein
MAEYIDKNATVGILEAMSRSADCECIKKRLEKAAKRVSAIPAADVAPVVQCNDCKHSWEDISGLCCSHGVCVDLNVPGDFYCAYGKRKEKGEK